MSAIDSMSALSPKTIKRGNRLLRKGTACIKIVAVTKYSKGLRNWPRRRCLPDEILANLKAFDAPMHASRRSSIGVTIR